MEILAYYVIAVYQLLTGLFWQKTKVGRKHRWASPFNPLSPLVRLVHMQTDNFRLFLRHQLDKLQSSVCTMSKR
jgi:hypothetical protein